MEIIVQQPVDLEHTFSCGQAFRWREENGWYYGLIGDLLVRMKKKAATYPARTILEIGHPEGADPRKVKESVWSLLRLDDDYNKVIKAISEDEYIREAVAAYPGLRLLRQDPWECLISYLCSAMANICQISANIERICRLYGERRELDGVVRYTFPGPEVLSRVKATEIRACKVGFRANYITKTARRIADLGVDLKELRDRSYSEARDFLLSFKGVGNKIADCVLAFSLDKVNAFPVDRWIRRAMLERYGEETAGENYVDEENVSDRMIRKFAGRYFGGYAAYAQEFIFYYRRTVEENEISGLRVHRVVSGSVRI